MVSCDLAAKTRLGLGRSRPEAARKVAKAGDGRQLPRQQTPRQPRQRASAEFVDELDRYFGIDRAVSAAPSRGKRELPLERIVPEKPASATGPATRRGKPHQDTPRSAALSSPLRVVQPRVGLRVVRGPDWRWGEQDGGSGTVGVVIQDTSSKNGWCTVRWASGYENGYRVGDGGYYDLLTSNAVAALVGPEPSDSSRRLLESRDPGLRPPGGIPAWSKPLLPAQDHGSKHRAAAVAEAPTRPVHTLPPGTRVQRGPDWRWGNQDGGPGGVGEVISVERSGWTSVRWASGYENGYRMGAEGKYDLQVARKGAFQQVALQGSQQPCPLQQKRQAASKVRCWCIDQYGDVLHLP